MVTRQKTSPVLVCDFDDTIVIPDTGDLILDKFATGDWRTLSNLYNSNKLTVEEVIRRQFSMVRASKKAMTDEIERAASIRPGFEELVVACSERRIPFVIVSYGLDFCIEHVLKESGLARNVEVHAPRTRLGPNGIHFSFPRLNLKGSVNFKHDLVRRYTKQGRKVTFVGDGSSDYPALKAADVRFAIKDSVLAGLCERDGIQHVQITDFAPVLRAMQDH